MSSTASSPDAADVLLDIARQYYLDDRSKVGIAKEFGLSRWQVARLLREARQQGYVKIQIGDQYATNAAVAAELADALKIGRARVIGRSNKSGPQPTVDSVAAELARVLTETLRPGQSVGLTWSRIIELMPPHLVELPPCDVVQLAGALSFTGDRLGSVEVTRYVARVANGTAYPFYAPLVVEDPRTAAALREQPEIADCLDRVNHLDVAVLTVGHWSPEGSAIYSLLRPELAQQVAAAGGCGDISARVFDADGNPVSPDLDECIVGITTDQLRAVPHRIATSYGEFRAGATVAAARAGLIDMLIVDEAQAQAILRRLS